MLNLKVLAVTQTSFSNHNKSIWRLSWTIASITMTRYLSVRNLKEPIFHGHIVIDTLVEDLDLALVV